MRSSGFSLIEVLVAMFVLAAGVLAAAATQAVAMRARHDSDLMTAAVRLGATLGERMHANPSAAGAYLFDFDSAGGAQPATPSVQCFFGSSCTPAQLAAFDLHDISQVLASAFPGGRIRVCRDAQPWNPSRQLLQWECADVPGAPIVVKIGWRERWAAADPARATVDAPKMALPHAEPQS